MAPYFRIAEANRGRRGNDQNTVKRTVQYLSVCRDPKIRNLVLAKSSDGVIKTICNAALNAERGDVPFTPAQKRLLARHRKQIALLTSRSVPLKKKRRALVQRGGFLQFLLPALLGPVISAIGNLLFNRGGNNQQQQQQ